MAGVGNPGYGVWETTDRCFQDAAGTKSLRCIGKDFRAAIAANSDYSNHGRKFSRAFPLLYFVNFRHTLRRHEFHDSRAGHELHEFESGTRIVTNFIKSI